MNDVKDLILFNVLSIKEEFDLDNSFFPVLLEFNVKTSEWVSGKIIYSYRSIDEEDFYDFGELKEIVESLDLHTYTIIKETIKEVVFQDIINITAEKSQQERLKRNSISLLKPLKQWICDCCGSTIQYGEGSLKWFKSRPKGNVIGIRESRYTGFQIVHTSKECSGTDNEVIDPLVESIHTLQHFESIDTIGYLMILLEEKSCFDSQELLEIIKRLQIPFYEEGRSYLDRALRDGVRPKEDEYKYNKSYLKSIINKYKDNSLHNLF